MPTENGKTLLGINDDNQIRVGGFLPQIQLLQDSYLSTTKIILFPSTSSELCVALKMHVVSQPTYEMSVCIPPCLVQMLDDPLTDGCALVLCEHTPSRNLDAASYGKKQCLVRCENAYHHPPDQIVYHHCPNTPATAVQ